MNWDAIGAVGEVLGAIAVLITLLLLLRQLRQNTDSLKIQSLNTIYGEWIAMTGELQTQPVLRSAFSKDANGVDLDDDELYVLVIYFVRMLNVNDKMYHLYREGSTDSYTLEGMKKTLLMVLRDSHFFADWWSSNSWRYSDPFQDFISKELDKGR